MLRRRCVSCRNNLDTYTRVNTPADTAESADSTHTSHAVISDWEEGKAALNKGLRQEKSFDYWRNAKPAVAPYYHIANRFKELMG